MSETTYPKSPVDHCTFHTLGSYWVFHYNINYQWLKRGYPVCSWECYAQFLLVASLMQGLFAKQASGKIPKESSPKDVPSGHRKWLAGTSTIVHHLQMIFKSRPPSVWLFPWKPPFVVDVPIEISISRGLSGTHDRRIPPMTIKKVGSISHRSWPSAQRRLGNRREGSWLTTSWSVQHSAVCLV